MNPDSKYKVPYRTWKARRPWSKLTTTQRVEIQRRRWEGESAKDLAAEFSVSTDTIYRQPPWDGRL